MLIPPVWQNTLAQVLLNNDVSAQSRYLQLATSDTDGTPSCRTMVFREFSQDHAGLIVHTDMRSAKLKQLQRLNVAEICWYFPHTREQFRLKGEILVIDSLCPNQSALRQRHWLALSDEVRASYTPRIDSQSPSIHFGLLQLTANRVEHLELQPLPHRRTVYWQQRNDGWQSERISP